MQLLAAVEADGGTPLVEAPRRDGRPAPPRDDRGHHHVVARPSLGPAAARRCGPRGVACVVVILTRPPSGQCAGRASRRRSTGDAVEPDTEADRARRQADAALRHALAEYELRVLPVSRARRSARSSPDEHGCRDPGTRRGPARSIAGGAAEGWIVPASVRRDRRASGLVHRRLALGPRSGRYLTPALVAAGRRRCRLHRPEGRLGPLADAPPGRRFAAIVLPILAGVSSARSRASVAAALADLYVATAIVVVQAWFDLAVRHLPSRRSTCHHIFVLGMLVWATAMFASYAVFGHRRPLNAVIVAGVVLLANMAITGRPAPAAVLVVFSRGAPVPADPVARLRRAVRLDPPSDRRPGVDLVGLSPRRDGLHRRRRHRLAQCSPRRPRRRPLPAPSTASRRPAQRVAIHPAVPADRRVVADRGPLLRHEHGDHGQVWTTELERGPHHRAAIRDKTHSTGGPGLRPIDAKAWSVATTTTTDSARATCSVGARRGPGRRCLDRRDGRPLSTPSPSSRATW